MNLIAIYGAGLLVGAAMVVIIPEGVYILYQSMQVQEPEGQDLSYIYSDTQSTITKSHLIIHYIEE